MKSIIVSFTLVLLCVVISVHYYTSKQRGKFPTTCHYLYAREVNTKKGLFNIKASYSLIKTSADKVELSIEGESEGGGDIYYMNRTLNYSLFRERNNDLYLLKFVDFKNKSDDNMPDDIFIMQNANLTANSLLQVKKMKANAYLLTSQLTPLPVCLTK